MSADYGEALTKAAQRVDELKREKFKKLEEAANSQSQDVKFLGGEVNGLDMASKVLHDCYDEANS